MRFISIVTALSVLVIPTTAQERFSFFQASTPESVERMLTLAALRDDDVVIDLGSGDGLIPLTAARMNRRLRGWGLDINAELVEQSNQRAAKEGVADRVRFEHKNAFDADLREATVVTMWLFPELMRLLRPVILERARPGTRVLTSTWDLGAWKPDKLSADQPPIYMWIVPASVAGSWEFDLTIAGRSVPYALLLEQRFQEVEGVARAGDRREVVNDLILRGDELTGQLKITLDGFGLTNHQFTGKVAGDEIVGTVKVTPSAQSEVTVPFRARRTATSRYFAATGTGGVPQPPPK
jgi:hypothetical protein